MVLVLPKKQLNFDHRREITKFSNILEDYENNTSEEDLSHLDEIMSLNDFSLDPGSGGPIHFKQTSLKNIENRALHHHIFDLELLNEIVDFLGKKVI